jgi:hypothetical protein
VRWGDDIERVLGLEAPQVDPAIMSIQSQIVTAGRNKEYYLVFMKKALTGMTQVWFNLEEMLVVEGLVFGGELLRQRRRQGHGRGRGSMVPCQGKRRRRENRGKGTEEDERGTTRRGSREAARGEEERGELVLPRV